jgi:hypothetical protein
MYLWSKEWRKHGGSLPSSACVKRSTQSCQMRTIWWNADRFLKVAFSSDRSHVTCAFCPRLSGATKSTKRSGTSKVGVNLNNHLNPFNHQPSIIFWMISIQSMCIYIYIKIQWFHHFNHHFLDDIHLTINRPYNDSDLSHKIHSGSWI